jgi:hypothetical protein
MRAFRLLKQSFLQRLSELRSYADAMKLVHNTPPHTSPARSLYSNLAFFLQNFSVPNGASGAELALYVQLVEAMESARELKPGVAPRVIDRLREAIAGRF